MTLNSPITGLVNAMLINCQFCFLNCFALTKTSEHLSSCHPTKKG